MSSISPCILNAKEAEKLMRGVFEYHPDAKEKLRDLQYLGVQMAIFAYA